jgi:hypothetical protein
LDIDKLIWTSFILFMGFISPAAGGDCPEIQVLKFDDHSNRVFVKGSKRELERQVSASKLVDSARARVKTERPEWRVWSVSFFQDANCAGYKDDPQILERACFSQSYLAEYSSETGLYVYRPADPKERKQFSYTPRRCDERR